MKLFQRNKEAMEVTISSQTVARVVALVIALLVFVSALSKASHALTLLFMAFFLSLSLNAPVHWIAQHLPGRKRGSRTLATGVSFLIVIGFLIAFIVSFVPPLVRQTSTFVDAAPSLIEDLRDQSSSLGSFVKKYNLQAQVDRLSLQVSGLAGSLTGSAVDTFGRVGSSIVSVLTVLVLTFMMLIEGPHWIKFARRLLPPEKEDYAELLVGDMYKVIKGYVNGQVLLATFAALLIAPPLFILGVGYPVALMVVVFVCGLIPMVGHSIGAVIVTFVALFTSPWAALIILCYYILYQQIENYAVQPRIQSNSTNMSPLFVFASVVVGVSVGGILGGLVAIPIAGCLRILLIDYLKRKQYLAPADARKLTTQ